MLVCDYIVERIDGDYAMLKRTNLPEEAVWRLSLSVRRGRNAG